MDAASLFFGRKLLEMIREKQREMQKPLLQGQALDFPDYKQRAGYLKGLADVIDMMETITMEDEAAQSSLTDFRDPLSTRQQYGSSL